MSEFKRTEYKQRPVHEWLEMASNGLIALPKFQRSYVWSNDKKAAYLEALFQKRPTGMIMILECNEEPQFDSRNFHGTDIQLTERPELVLDGQQRITSLWHMLIGSEDSDSKFYIKVKGLIQKLAQIRDGQNLPIDRVVHFTNRSKDGKTHEDPKKAFQNGMIPVKILWEGEADWLLYNWCATVYDTNREDAHRLGTQLKKGLRNPLLREQLFYCELPDTTSKDNAVDIFVNTNISSAHITEFDIMVARAEGWHEEDLRDKIEEYHSKSKHVEYYFDQDEEKYIPDIGTELLKVACLKINKPPKRAYYKDALKSIFGDGTESNSDNFNRLSENLDEALLLAAQHGGATKKTLPSWPPVYVVAALQDGISTIRSPDKMSTVNSLLSAYLWHSFLSNRHESQANDRLYEDFIDLSKCIKHISSGKDLNNKIRPRIFDGEDHPLLSEEEISSLDNPLPWIGSSSRSARGIMAFIMSMSPMDWITGEPLTWNEIREHERRGRLERHHIFPKSILTEIYNSKKEKGKINHGLNGVLISKDSNRAMSNKDPAEYLQDRLEKIRPLNEQELKERVGSHFVRYGILMESGSVKRRYQKFIGDRAKWIGDELRKQSTKTKKLFLG